MVIEGYIERRIEVTGGLGYWKRKQ